MCKGPYHGNVCMAGKSYKVATLSFLTQTENYLVKTQTTLQQIKLSDACQMCV